MTTRLVLCAVDALGWLSNLLRNAAERLDDAATHTSRLAHRLHDHHHHRWTR